jgi:hypothetical protein
MPVGTQGTRKAQGPLCAALVALVAHLCIGLAFRLAV